MTVAISEQAEARLVKEARRQGITVDALLERLINERTSGRESTQRTTPEIPSWRLGVTGSLHRRDIYDDAR